MDVAALGIKVDASGVSAATKELERFTEQGRQAEKALDGVSSGSRVNIRDSSDLAKAVSSLNEEEKKYIQSITAEARMLNMSRGEKAAYIAASRGMSESAQALAKAIGDKTDALKAEQKEIAKTAAATDSFAGSVKLATAGVQAFMGLKIVGWAKDAAVAMFEASAAAERLQIGLSFASARGGAAEVAYLRGVTNELGLSFASTAKSYMQFQAAAKGTSLEGDKARAVFESVSKASAVMGLSAEQSSGALTALQQMVSKGTVASEELRGQLSERLPGAFQIASRAMGVTTQELGKMLEAGQVMSEDFLPKFAKQLEKELGGAAETAAQRLDASVNRFNNAWDQLKQAAGDSGISKAIAKEMDAVGKDMSVVSEAISNASKTGSGAFMSLAAGATVAAGRAGFAGLNLAANTVNGTINLLTGGILGLNTNLAVLPDSLKSNAEQVKILQANVAEAEKHLSNLQARSAKAGGGAFYEAEIARARGLVAEYRAALAAKQALTGDTKTAAEKLMDRELGAPRGGGQVKYEREQEAVRQRGLEITAKANGITKEYISTLAVYEDQLKYNLITEAEFVANVTALNKERYESTKAGKEEAKALKSSASAASAAQSEYAKLMASISAKLEQDKAELEYGRKLTDAEKLRLVLNAKSVQGATKLTAADKASAMALLERADAAAKDLKIDQERRKAAEDFEKLRTKEADQAAETVAKIHERASAMEDEVANYGKSKDAIEETIIARLEERKAILEGFEGNEAVIAQINAEIEARQRLATVMGEKAVLDADKKAREHLQKSWDKTAQMVGDTLADYIMGGGKDAATYLKRLFATLVLEPVVNYGVQSLLGAVGMGGGSTGGSNALGVLNNASSLNSAYSLFGGGMSAANSVGTGIANLTGTGIDGLLATNGAYGTAGGVQGAAGSAFSSAMSYAGYAAAIAYGMKLSANAYDEGYRGNTKHLLSSGVPVGISIATDVTKAIGGIFGMSEKTANIITGGSLWAKGLDKLGFKAKTSHTGAGAIYENGKLTEGAGIYNGAGVGIGQAKEYNASAQVSVSGVAQSIGSTLESVAAAFGKDLSFRVSTAFADDRSKDGAWGALKISDALGNVLVNWENTRTSKWAPREFADGEAGFNQYVSAVQADVLTAIQAMNLPGWAKDMFAAAQGAEGLQAALQGVGATLAVFEQLGYAMKSFAGIGDEVVKSLLNGFGLEGLTAVTSSYYQNFYSESERMAAQLEQVQKAMAGLNLGWLDPAMGEAAKEQFRETVDIALQTGQGELAKHLLSLNDSFATAANYAAKSAQDASEIIRAEAEATQAALEAVVARVSAAWGNLQSASGLAATYLGDTSGLQAQLDILRASVGESTDNTDRLAAVQQIVALEESLWQADEANRRAAVQAAQAQEASLREQLASVQALATAARNLRAFVEDLRTGELSGLTESQRAAALSTQYSSQLARANTGDVSAFAELQRTTTDLLGLSANTASTQAEYNIISARMAAELEATAAIQDASASSAELQLEQSIAAAQVAQEQATAQFKVSADTQRLIKELLGSSMTAFALEQENAAAALASGAQTNALLAGLPEGLGAVLSASLVPAINGLAAAQAAAAQAAQAQAAAAAEANRIAAGAFPQYAVGTPYVPETGLAMIHEGEMIVPRQYNPNAGAPVSRAIATADEDARLQNAALLTVMTRLLRKIDQWDADGLPHPREEYET